MRRGILLAINWAVALAVVIFLTIDWMPLGPERSTLENAIFVLLYLNNRPVTTTFIVFSGVAVSWSGGFLLLWLHGRPGFPECRGTGFDVIDGVVC